MGVLNRGKKKSVIKSVFYLFLLIARKNKKHAHSKESSFKRLRTFERASVNLEEKQSRGTDEQHIRCKPIELAVLDYFHKEF